jgi:DNA-binding MarR family transcriptional regulator
METERLIDRILALKRKCRIEEKIGGQLGLTPGEINCIWSLGAKTKLVCQDLARQLHLSPSRCSRVIQNLINKGYLEREEKDGDRRSLLISLSIEGERCWREIEQARSLCEQDLLTRLSREDLVKVEQGLKILIGTL